LYNNLSGSALILNDSATGCFGEKLAVGLMQGFNGLRFNLYTAFDRFIIDTRYMLSVSNLHISFSHL
jgi:hypothetical protein